MRLHYVLLTILCCITLALRLVNLDAHGIGGDEKNSLFVSQFVPMGGSNQHDVFFKSDTPYFTPAEFWKKKSIADFYEAGARVDNGSSAAHALLLHYWTGWFGLSDGVLRGVSVLFGVLIIPLLFLFVQANFRSSGLALGVAALACIEPLYVGWSQVVRTYTMTYFFCLLATYLFFELLRAEATKKRFLWLYVAYGLCAFVCLMCHYSVFTLFGLHGLLLLLFYRNVPLWLRFGGAMLIPTVGMIWWLTAGGGQYASKFIEDSRQVYNQMAATNPQLGYLAPTSFFAVGVQLLPILANHFLPTNGFFDALMGKQNLLICLISIVGTLLIYCFVGKEFTKRLLLLAFLLLAFSFYSIARIQFIGLVAAILLLLVAINDTMKQTGESRRMYLSMWILAIFPLFFLILFAIQDGNTFRVQQKYAGYGVAFSLILIALAIRGLWATYPAWVRYALSAVLLAQVGFVGQTIRSIWVDTAPRYLQYSNPRTYNPYRTVAQRILSQYSPGDTLVYPSYSASDNHYNVSPSNYPVTDAQLINFYLPKDAQYWQRIDRFEPNKVVLKKADGTQQLLFDFKGQTYRY
jgi:4-amino-4-deoxy-L-arabinose transferase-like glycosyltransferase